MADFYYRGPDKSTAIERLEQANLLAVDTETVNLQDYTCIGIGIYISDNEGMYFETFPEPSEYLPLVMHKLSDPTCTKIYHNGGNFDLPVLDKLGNEEGFLPPDDVNYQDTSIMAAVHGLPASLERLGREWLGYDDLFSIRDLFNEHGTRNMLDVPTIRVAQKCLNDCRTTWKLYEYLNSRLSPNQRDCYEIDRKLISRLRKVESKGLALRQGLLEEYYERLSKDVLKIRADCDAEGFNPRSPSQVGFVLAARGNILPFTKSKKQLQSGEQYLEELDDPLAKTILEFRSKDKLLSTYVKPWLKKDRAYTHFRLDLATGRLASGKINSWDTKNRNLQNIPPAMREIFRPDSGIWTWADYSQVELRVLAYISQDYEMMLEYAKEKPDLHSATAKATGLTRDGGKTFNFAMVFGASDHHLSKTLGVPLTDVKIFKARWKATFKGAAEYMDRQMYEHGEWVETAFGRRCRLPEMQEGADYNPKKFDAHVSKCAINYPVQGTAADIIKRGMVQVIDSGVDLRVQVHDEYVVDGLWEPDNSLAHIHPELFTPFEVKSSPVWV